MTDEASAMIDNNTDTDIPGEFSDDWTKTERTKCRACGSPDVFYRVWESSCGGYEDYKFRCRACDHSWWVDGPDA